MRLYPFLALLLLTACQPTPEPPPPPQTTTPPAPAPPPKPAADMDAAIDAFLAKLNQADPSGALVSEVGEAGQDGAIALRVTDNWRMLPMPTREGNAQDLYNIWVDEWTKSGGNRSLAMVFFVDRSGNTVGRVTSAGVKLNP